MDYIASYKSVRDFVRDATTFGSLTHVHLILWIPWTQYLTTCTYIHIHLFVPYSRKYWRGHKFGGLAVGKATVKLKSANISYTRIYVWRYRTKPPNLKTANISGYTVYNPLYLHILKTM